MAARYSVGGVYVGGPATIMAVFYLTHMDRTKDTRRYCLVFDALPSEASLSINNRARVKTGHTVTFGPVDVSFDGKFVIAMALCDGAVSFLDRALTDVEFRQVGQYLSRRYGIAGGY